jgi:predicted nucleic acid-binding protein
VTLVDTNVLIDIVSGDRFWATRSIEALSAAARRGRLAINDTVYAELSAGFTAQSELEETIAEMSLTLPPMSRPALFLAGQAFRRYRAGGGQRPNVLADFFIGAQASVERWPLLTRDARICRNFFPDVRVVGVD